MAARSYTRFLAQFLREPRVVGAVAPSSETLARRMVQWIHWPAVRAAVEYGPGTGAFTGRIRSSLAPGARFFAVEVNPILAAALRREHPGVRIHLDSVQNIAALCAREGLASVDAIISGLPWASFSGPQQDALLASTFAVLTPGGFFATFAYLHGLALPAGQRFRRLLHRCFRTVQRSPVVWRNLPPAFVYRCRR